MPDEGGGDDGPLMEVNWYSDAACTFIFLVEIVALLRHAQVNLTRENIYRQPKPRTLVPLPLNWRQYDIYPDAYSTSNYRSGTFSKRGRGVHAATLRRRRHRDDVRHHDLQTSRTLSGQVDLQNLRQERPHEQAASDAVQIHGPVLATNCACGA